MSLVPMYLCRNRCAIGESDPRDSFPLSPSPRTVDLLETVKFTNLPARRDRLDRCDLTQQFDIQA